MIWAHIKEWLGDLWGMSTTLVLALLIPAVPALQAVDPELLPNWAKLTIAMAGVAVAVLRVVAPPPPTVSIKTNDHVDVNPSGTVVTIVKADGVPSDVQTKAAGEPT